MGKYDAVAKRTLSTISRKGGVATFTRDEITGGAGIYDPMTDTWTSASGGTASYSSQDVPAVQIPNDPEHYQAQGLVFANPILLLAAAVNDFVPDVGDYFTWNTKRYSVKSVEPVAPDGTPIMYTVMGAE